MSSLHSKRCNVMANSRHSSYRTWCVILQSHWEVLASAGRTDQYWTYSNVRKCLTASAKKSPYGAWIVLAYCLWKSFTHDLVCGLGSKQAVLCMQPWWEAPFYGWHCRVIKHCESNLPVSLLLLVLTAGCSGHCSARRAPAACPCS